jgi:glyoxylase-like metal-dependent hydrolase (beta-lactamase superfamily II)
MSTNSSTGIRFEQVSNRIIVALGPVAGERAGSNSTIVLGDHATLVIDTMMTPALIQVVKDEAERLGGRPVGYVFNTHADPDHLLGNGVFPGAEVIAHRRVAELLADPEIQASYEKHLEGTGVALRGPDTTFELDFELNLGGLTVHAKYAGPAHSEADTVLWIPEERAYFAADTVFSGLFPLVRNNLSNWFAALDYGISLEPMVVVPGHGPVGDAGLLAWQRGVLERIHEAVLALHGRGMPLAEATATPVPDGLQLPLANARWPVAITGIYGLLG